MTAPGSEAAVSGFAGLAVTSAPSRRPVSNRRRRLTAREVDVLAAMANTGARKAAAHALGISEATTRHHLTSAYGKLGAESAIDAFRLLGWLQVPGDHRYATELLAMAESITRDLIAAAAELRAAVADDERAA